MLTRYRDVRTAADMPSSGRIDDEQLYLAQTDGLLAGLDAGEVGVWVWDIAANTIRWSKNLEEIHNLSPGSFDGSFSFFENDIHPDDRKGVLAAIQRAQREAGQYRVRYRVPQRAGTEERWIEARGKALSVDGVATHMLGVCQDVTDGVRLEHELLHRARQQEVVADLGWEALTEPNLERILDKAVSSVRQELSVELVKVLELVPGDKELLLRAGVGWEPGLVGHLHVPIDAGSQAGYSLSVGKPVVVEDLRLETRFAVPQLLHDHGVVSGISVIIAGRDGRAYGVLGGHSRALRHFTERDVAFMEAVANVIAAATQQRLADARQSLLIRELRHHSGNLFAQLLALFSQTAKTSRSIGDLTTKYEARVLAFANAHKLIAEGGWKSTSLMQLLKTLLGAFAERVRFDGPDVFLEPEPAFGLSSALHELTTNAMNYGSLSSPAGQLDLSWSIARSELGPTLHFNWLEKNGPPVKSPRKRGFGSKLIKAVIERQLNGTVQQSFDPSGLHTNIRVALTHERWPGNRRISGEADAAPLFEDIAG